MSKPSQAVFKVTSNTTNTKSTSKQKKTTPTTVVIKLYLSYAYNSKTKTYKIKTQLLKNGHLSLNALLSQLSKSIKLETYTISYNETGSDIYFYCGVYPFNQFILCELTDSKSLWVKLRRNINNKNRLKLDLLEDEEIMNVSLNDYKKTNYHINTNSRRNNERLIGYIINKVYLWKRLSRGIIGSNGKILKLTLEEAAKLTEVKKKSLIEYQQQLQLGRLLGFNFNKNRNEKVNVLRGYVKNQMNICEVSTLRKLRLLKKILKKIEEDGLSEVEKKDDSSIEL